MVGSVVEQAASLIEQETGSSIESTRIVEQLTTDEEAVLVIAVDTCEDQYWVVTGGRGPATYRRTQHASAEAVLSAYVRAES